MSNTESIRLRWKQARESHQAMMRYPAHAVQDVDFLLQRVYSLEQQVEKLRWAMIKRSVQ